MAGYVRQASADIQPGQIVKSVPLNAEFNALASAFNNLTGHSHDGTTGNGPKLDINGATFDTLTVARGGTGATDAATARTNLGLGDMAVQNKISVDIDGGTVDNVAITGGTITTAAITNSTIDDATHGNRSGGALHADATTVTAGFMSAADKTKLDGVETGATADQTAGEIKTLYESNLDTNAFTDALLSKLNGIEAGATGDQTAGELLTAIKTVDGAASGLDADLLDGQHASAFSLSGHTHVAANITDFTSAVQTIGDARYGRLASANTWTATNWFESTTGVRGAASASLYMTSTGSAPFVILRTQISANSSFAIQHYNAASSLIEVPYQITRNGTTFLTDYHTFTVANTSAARIEAAGTAVPQTYSVITREKGDARYSQLGHTHVKADITDFAHTHVAADVTDFTTAVQTVGDARYAQLSGATFTGDVTMSGALFASRAGSGPAAADLGLRIGGTNGFYTLAATHIRVGVNGSLAAQFDEAGSAASGATTLITREKGDARYLQLSGGTVTGAVTVNANLTMGSGGILQTVAGAISAPGLQLGVNPIGLYVPAAGIIRATDGTNNLAQFDSEASGLAQTFSVVTRVKGDARYARGEVMHVQDRQTSGTNGGSAVATTWSNRVLNTTVTNTITGASLASNQITLPAGNYWVMARSPYGWGGVMSFTTRLRNTTDGTTDLIGSGGGNGGSGSSQDDAWCIGYLSLAGTKVFNLQYWSSVARATDGLGKAVGSGMQEVYSEVFIWKLP